MKTYVLFGLAKELNHLGLSKPDGIILKLNFQRGATVLCLVEDYFSGVITHVMPPRPHLSLQSP